ncbi:NRDE family protein [Limisalsivibrio acetivorans]|uniref:NRDE family protein n=1 Tax=Limisalsivibrio acetivorans TaxID=1304888 RepID=UPI0003B544E3|nr:NRDE family protein [Limisalsivibrio acetivorans]
MCLIIFSYKQHPQYKLVFAANRDEFHYRLTKEAGWWEPGRDILGGIDIEAGGTWLGITRTGRFAALTNFRSPDEKKENMRSRGMLTKEFLTCDVSVEEYTDKLEAEAKEFNGYNLIYGDIDHLHYFSNRGKTPAAIPEGLHGLSNALLNDPWPKVMRGKVGMAKILQQESITAEQLMLMLKDEVKPPDEELPETGVPKDWERSLSPMFIRAGEYGTRASTVILIDYDNNVHFHERTFTPDGKITDIKEEFRIQS